MSVIENAQTALRDGLLRRRVNGLRAIVTGASSGVGRAAAIKLAAAGCNVVLVARREDELQTVADEIAAAGGAASVYPCNLADLEAIDSVFARILVEQGDVDILINNAGRSIRRSVLKSADRFHDFERTMQLNYFAAVRAILRLLPGMTERKRGYVVNVLSMGVLSKAPRFAAYLASKSALDTFGRCLAPEVAGKNVHISSIYLPLVRTPMIAPTAHYKKAPAISPEAAADMVLAPLRHGGPRIATVAGTGLEVLSNRFPRAATGLLSMAYRRLPEQ